jgi:hypothetical protein
MSWTQPALRAVGFLFVVVALAFVVGGAAILAGAKSAVHEIEAGIAWLLAITATLVSVTSFGFAGVLHALWDDDAPPVEAKPKLRRRR